MNYIHNLTDEEISNVINGVLNDVDLDDDNAVCEAMKTAWDLTFGIKL